MATVALMASARATTASSTIVSLIANQALDASNNPVAVTTTSSVIHFAPVGDFNGDGQVAVEDAVLLANAILTAMTTGCGNNAFSGLTMPQLEAADVAFPFAMPQTPPIFARNDFTCANITSADVAAIARMASSTGGASAASALQALTPFPPWNAMQIESLALMPVMPRSGGVAELSVHGYGITSLELRFYDLAGRLILNEFADGSRLRFQLADGLGRPLARGVYLYMVTVHGARGEVSQTEVRKLIVR